MLGIEAQAAFEDLPTPRSSCVPGGTGTNDFLEDERLVGWIREAHETLRVDDVGLHRLAPARRRGLLEGLEATVALARHDRPRALRGGADEQARRRAGQVVTAAGVSSGIDMGLVLAAKIAGAEVAQAIQLGIEYDPQPPFDTGSTDKAPTEIVELVRRGRSLD